MRMSKKDFPLYCASCANNSHQDCGFKSARLRKSGDFSTPFWYLFSSQGCIMFTYHHIWALLFTPGAVWIQWSYLIQGLWSCLSLHGYQNRHQNSPLSAKLWSCPFPGEGPTLSYGELTGFMIFNLPGRLVKKRLEGPAPFFCNLEPSPICWPNLGGIALDESVDRFYIIAAAGWAWHF